MIEETRCNKTLYIICIIILVAIIIGCIIYLIKNVCTPPPPPPEQTSTEGYVVSTGPVSKVNGSVYAGNGPILTNGVAEKTFAEMIPSNKPSYIKDYDIPPEHNQKVDEIVSKGQEAKKYIDAAREKNILTREEMQKVALAQHEAEQYDMSLLKRVDGRPKKLMIMENTTVPVLNKGKNPSGMQYPFFTRGISNKILATDRISEVPYYEIGGSLLGRELNGSNTFRPLNPESKVILDLQLPGTNKDARMKQINEKIIDATTGKAIMHNSDNTTTSYNMNGSVKTTFNGYMIDPNTLTAKQTTW